MAQPLRLCQVRFALPQRLFRALAFGVIDDGSQYTDLATVSYATTMDFDETGAHPYWKYGLTCGGRLDDDTGHVCVMDIPDP